MRHSGPCGRLALVATKVHQDAHMKIAQCGCMMRRIGRNVCGELSRTAAPGKEYGVWSTDFP